MVDAFPKKLEGEGMDYCHGLSLIESPRIDFDTGNIHTYIYIYKQVEQIMMEDRETRRMLFQISVSQATRR